MASIKDLKKRIGTVKNTQQTTRAMKMVSAAKLRRAQEAIQNQRPYARRIAELIQLMVNQQDEGIVHPLMKREKPEGEVGQKKCLVIAVTSDRGLCGGFNSNVIKACQRWIAANQSPDRKIVLGFVGRKGHDFFKHKNAEVFAYYPEMGGKVTFAKAKKLADILVQLYLNEEVDEVKFIFNEFKNAVTQKVIVEDFLPLSKNEDPVSAEASEGNRDFIIKPSREEVLRKLLEKNFAIQAFRVLLESQAGEHGARMSAMENATKNAGEMIRKLTLQFNKQRQAGITKELLEIIAGSESQKG